MLLILGLMAGVGTGPASRDSARKSWWDWVHLAVWAALLQTQHQTTRRAGRTSRRRPVCLLSWYTKGEAWGYTKGMPRQITAAAPMRPILPLYQRETHTRGNIWSFTVGWHECYDPTRGVGALFNIPWMCIWHALGRSVMSLECVYDTRWGAL